MVDHPLSATSRVGEGDAVARDAASDRVTAGGGAGAALVLAGAVLWGTTGTASALGPDSATPLAVGATRLVAGGALLVLWAAVAAGLGARSKRPERPTSVAHVRLGAARPPRSPHVRRGAGVVGRWRRERVVAGVAGALGVAAYQASFFAAVDRAGVALGTAVAIGSAPVFTGLIEWVTAGRRPTPRWWAATVLATIGVGVLAGPSSLHPAGIALALAAGGSYAVYAVASKRLLDTGLDSPTAMAVIFGGGGMLLLPVLVVVDLSWVASGRGLAMIAWLAIATTLLSYLLFGAGLRTIPAATAATLSLAEPLTAAILGLAVLGERPTTAGVMGAAVILLGLLVLLSGRQRPPVAAPG